MKLRKKAKGRGSSRQSSLRKRSKIATSPGTYWKEDVYKVPLDSAAIMVTVAGLFRSEGGVKKTEFLGKRAVLYEQPGVALLVFTDTFLRQCMPLSWVSRLAHAVGLELREESKP